MKNRKIYVYACMALILAILPVFLKDKYWIDVLNNIGIYAILALSLNIIVGHTGLFNLGHAAFYAVGAYTTAIINTSCQIPTLWLLPVSGITAAIFAAIVARPIIHLRGDYLCIVTIGMGEIVRIAVINNIFGLTKGSNGIFGIARPHFFEYVIKTPADFYYFIGIFLALTIFLFYRLENSRFGRALNYIREDETAASGSGIDTAKYKLAAFVTGAAWAGMAGNIFAAKMTTIAPESFNFWESVLVFTIVILGGSGSIPGVLAGSVIVIGLPEIFRDLSNARMLVFGLAMILMAIFRNRGLVPPLPRSYRLPSVKTDGGMI